MKAVENEIDSDTNCRWSVRNGLQMHGTGNGRNGNQKHEKHRIVEKSHNSEMIPGDVRRL